MDPRIFLNRILQIAADEIGKERFVRKMKAESDELMLKVDEMFRRLNNSEAPNGSINTDFLFAETNRMKNVIEEKNSILRHKIQLVEELDVPEILEVMKDFLTVNEVAIEQIQTLVREAMNINRN